MEDGTENRGTKSEKRVASFRSRLVSSTLTFLFLARESTQHQNQERDLKERESKKRVRAKDQPSKSRTETKRKKGEVVKSFGLSLGLNDESCDDGEAVKTKKSIRGGRKVGVISMSSRERARAI